MAEKSEHVVKKSKSAEMSEALSSEILNLMKEHPSLKYDQESKKIRCQLSGHDLPCQLAALVSYTSGKKYKKLRSHDDFHYRRYEPHIIQSKKKHSGHMLFCKLTLRELSKTPTDVERHINGRRYRKALSKCKFDVVIHINGRRYRKALSKFEECQRLGIKFIPPSRQKRQSAFGAESDGEEKKFSTNPEDSGDESDAESVDSLSDLYPVVDFEVDEEEEEEEEEDQDGEAAEDDVENMEVQDTRPTKQARKNTDQGSGDTQNKKFKTGNQNKKRKGTQEQQQTGKGNESSAPRNQNKSKGKKKKPRIM